MCVLTQNFEKIKLEIPLRETNSRIRWWHFGNHQLSKSRGNIFSLFQNCELRHHFLVQSNPEYLSIKINVTSPLRTTWTPWALAEEAGKGWTGEIQSNRCCASKSFRLPPWKASQRLEIQFSKWTCEPWPLLFQPQPGRSRHSKAKAGLQQIFKPLLSSRQ